MGHVRTKTVKRAARQIIEKYYSKLSVDFQNNKAVCADVASIPTKHVRNQVAGYVTHLYKRLQKGPVRGISLKLQEQERERRDNYTPAKSALSAAFNVDAESAEMLAALGLDKFLSNVQ